MDHRTIKSAKVVFVPIGTKLNKDGELKTVFVRMGIRVDMLDGSWWFKHFRAGTWTHHWDGLESGSCFPFAPVKVERKQSYSRIALEREYAGNRRKMIVALEEGEQLAYAEEAAKRAA